MGMVEKRNDMGDKEEKEITTEELVKGVELSWDTSNNLPRIEFKNHVILNHWFSDEIWDEKQSNEYLKHIQKYFIEQTINQVRKGIYQNKDKIKIIVLAIPKSKLKIILEVKDSYYKFCLKKTLESAIMMEQYELCSDIQETISEIDDIKKFLKEKKIKHKSYDYSINL